METTGVDVTVSIVNWNTRDELRECLKSALQQEGAQPELIVVDNGSTDGSAEMVRSEFPDIVALISNTTNLGFGAAHNQALAIARGRCALLLNPDCRFLSSSVIAKMAAYMDANADVGMLGPKILYPDGRLQYSARHFPTMFAASFRHTILGKLFPNNRFVRSYMMTDWAHDQVADIDWLSGSALMARKEMYDQIGLLDSRFFMYCEDVDWCKRAHLAGWRVVYYPEVSVSHRIGASSDLDPIHMIKQHHKSMLRYFLKYDLRSPKIVLLPIVLIGLWLRMWSRVRQTHPVHHNP